MQERLITFSCLLQCREVWSTSLAFAIIDTLVLFMLITPFKSIFLSWLIPTGDVHGLMESPYQISSIHDLSSSKSFIPKHLFTGTAQCLVEIPMTSQQYKGLLNAYCKPLECLLLPTTTLELCPLIVEQPLTPLCSLSLERHLLTAYGPHLTTSSCSLALPFNIFPHWSFTCLLQNIECLLCA